MTTIVSTDISVAVAALWDTTRMRVLVEIDRQGSLSAAAAAIGIGQSSVSEHLRLLELRRGSGSSSATVAGAAHEAGRVLAGRAAQALAVLGAGEEELDALAGLQTGTITSAPRPHPASTSCPTRSAASVATIRTSGSTSRSRRAARSSSVSWPGASNSRSSGPTPETESSSSRSRRRDRRGRPARAPARQAGIVPLCARWVMLLAREPESSTQELADTELRAAGVTPAGVWELGSSEAVKRAAREARVRLPLPLCRRRGDRARRARALPARRSAANQRSSRSLDSPAGPSRPANRRSSTRSGAVVPRPPRTPPPVSGSCRPAGALRIAGDELRPGRPHSVPQFADAPLQLRCLG